MKLIFAFTLSLLFTNTLWAYDSLDNKYFQISEVESYQVVQGAPVYLSSQKNFAPLPSKYVTRPMQEDILSDEIINIGQWIWKIIEENKPTANFKQKKASGIPGKAVTPQRMENWESPTSLTYLMIFKNGFGSEVVRFKYKVIYSPKGSYEGKGQYLANVSIHPAEIDVSWGFDFNANVEIDDVLNLSSNEDPLAGIQIAMRWNVESLIKYIEGQDIYFVQGDGDHKQL